MTVPSDKSDPIFSTQPIKSAITPQTAPAGFQDAMSEAASRAQPKAFTSPQAPAINVGTQPFLAQPAAPAIDTLIAQISTSQDSLANVRNKLNVNPPMKRAQMHLVRNRLTDASTYLRAANAKLGAETPPMPSQAGARPIERFLNYVTDGENQLAAAQDKIGDMQKSGNQLRPADFLIVQIKLSQAQQEIEYSSVLLSKVIDSIKSTLNIQL
jgi:hypothetical protein